MDYFNEKHKFDEKTCEVFTEIIQQDSLNIKVLYYIVQCQQTGINVTVKSIADNLKIRKRTAIKNQENKIVKFIDEEGLIERKRAEKIVERLAYASLIYFDIQRPHKFIKLTRRGVQIVFNLKQMEAKKK
ncbi:hypothetical protein MKX73_03385 [Solibacillus sp. FSL W7-1436]|uniref:hypothetical protein n=1 Tax=Solibacillus sp. FSL W7-1436 TaxID=2921705 RepID=UPI0030F99223